MPVADPTVEGPRVDPVVTLDTPDFEALHDDALQTRFGALTRLVDEWRSGANRFAKPGEVLLAAWIADRVVGIGGLNIDPFAHRPEVGRIRRLYVIQEARRQGVGTSLVSAIESAASASGMSTLQLRTVDQRSAAFYEALGYESIQGEATVTHRKILVGP